MTVADLAEWISSTRHIQKRVVNGHEEVMPYDLFHARRIGSTTTACGEAAFYWTNVYERPYVPGDVSACLECDKVVRGRPR